MTDFDNTSRKGMQTPFKHRLNDLPLIPLTNLLHSRSRVFKQAVKGFTLPETLLAISLVGILTAIAAPSIGLIVSNPLEDTASRIRNNIKLARVKAISTTTARRIQPLSVNQFILETHSLDGGTVVSGCNDSAIEIDIDGNDVWVTNPGFSSEDLQFGDGVTLTAVTVDGLQASTLTDWDVCFDSRGRANANIVFELTDSRGEQRQIEVLRGGSTRLL